MKQLLKHGLLLLVPVIGMCIHGTAQSTQMIVTMNDGTAQTFAMDEADRVTFEDNTTLIIQQGVGQTMIPLADIRKIVCDETMGGQSEHTMAKASITPNPVHDVMMFHNLNGVETINIYTLDGRLMKTFESSGEEFISTEDLAKGLYLVKTQTCVLKIIKL